MGMDPGGDFFGQRSKYANSLGAKALEFEITRTPVCVPGTCPSGQNKLSDRDNLSLASWQNWSKLSKVRDSVPASAMALPFTFSGFVFGGVRPANLRSSGLLILKADRLRGVTPSPFRAQLNS